MFEGACEGDCDELTGSEKWWKLNREWVEEVQWLRVELNWNLERVEIRYAKDEKVPSSYEYQMQRESMLKEKGRD